MSASKWFEKITVSSADARAIAGSDDPVRIQESLNLTLAGLTPAKIAIPSEETCDINVEGTGIVKFPISYDIKPLVVTKKSGRKAVYKPNGTKGFACLHDGCINSVTKYNYCNDHRDVAYEKAFTTTVTAAHGTTLLVSLNGVQYKDISFRVTANRHPIVANRTWFLNPRNEVFSEDGKLIDLLVGEGWKCKQKVAGVDYTNSNLEFARNVPYVPDGKSVCHVPLSGDKGFGVEAKVDREMSDFVAKYPWNLDNGGYARCKAGLMHRLIMASVHGESALDGMVIDHIDGDRLNNTFSNLRIATYKANAKNRTSKPPSGFEGVYELPEGGYVCRIKNIDVFRDTNPKMCALVHDSVVTFVYGPGERLNDNVSAEPVPIERWNLAPEVLVQLATLKASHTNLHGVKKVRDGWKASVTLDLGVYAEQEDAGKAYDIVVMLMKSAAPLNFDASKYTGKDFATMMRKLFDM